MSRFLISGLLILVSTARIALAAHAFTFINNCDIPVLPVVSNVGKAPSEIQAGGQWTATIPETWEGGRMWGVTPACPDEANGAGCTLGECSLYPAGSTMRSQCNLSLASGMNAAATLVHGSQSKHCTGFDDGECFPTGETCTSGACLTDDPDVNSSITMTISGCLAQSASFGGANSPAGASGGAAVSGATSSTSSSLAVPASGSNSASVSSASIPSFSDTTIASGTNVASTPSTPASQVSNTAATQSVSTGRWGGGRGYGRPPRRRSAPGPSRHAT